MIQLPSIHVDLQHMITSSGPVKFVLACSDGDTFAVALLRRFAMSIYFHFSHVYIVAMVQGRLFYLLSGQVPGDLRSAVASLALSHRHGSCVMCMSLIRP